ncbi:DUF58 domain-containing protein [Gemmatimonas aurantiaca]|nr:DUF58 domain-containing protein [Gemmatimonas aurantiaca]
MPSPQSQFLDPKTVSKLDSLELRARLMVEGFIAGLHKSPFHGFSVEFAERRQYMPGDPIKLIDWKHYAKSDRYYIKQYEEETNLKSHILLDLSASMGYASDVVTKRDYAGTLAAALAYLNLKQRDAVGLVTFDKTIRSVIPPASKSGQLNQLLREIASQKPADTTDVGSALHLMAEQIKRRGLVILISDLLDDPESIISGLRHFRHNRHEVIVFHIVDPRERDFAFREEAIFKDMETGEEITTLPWQIKQSYAESFKEFSSFLSLKCSESKIDYHLIDTSTPFDQALYAFLGKRARLY